jgi:hypothetical protein
MKNLQKIIILVTTPNIALAGNGGGAIVGLIFFPLILWGIFKIWKFLIKIIFSNNKTFENSPQRPTEKYLITQPQSDETKECPFCAELVLSKAKKCKHCGSIIA